MNQAFQITPDALQSALNILYPLSYTREEMDSFGWNIDLCDDPTKFDISLVYDLLGGYLPSKIDYKNIN